VFELPFSVRNASFERKNLILEIAAALFRYFDARPARRATCLANRPA
jgi:hypothetical protein